MRVLSLVLVVAALSGLGLGQQSGDANRNYLVNFQGSNQASPVQSTVVDCGACGSFHNGYFTSDSGAPVIWMSANEASLGWIDTGTNSVDIGPTGLTFLLDGTDASNPLSFFLRTDPDGTFVLHLLTPGILQGTTMFSAMAHVASSSPDGFWVSQTHEIGFDPENQMGNGFYSGPTGSATVLSTIGDDDSIPVGIGFSFSFFGATYSTCYIGSNGFLTFGAGSTDFSESLTDLITGPRRIAGWWDDLNPTQGGVIAYESETINHTFGTDRQLTVWYEHIREYGYGQPATFSIRLKETTSATVIRSIQIHYGSELTGDGLVGISRGSTFLPPAPVEIDFSQGPISSLPFAYTYYELFDDETNPQDVMGQRLYFFLDAAGQPVQTN